MKHCPLCGAQYRDDTSQCTNCAAELVRSSDAQTIRVNPPRLLWIGRNDDEFNAVASSLRERHIPANAQLGVGGVVGALLQSESKIFVLEADLDRALEAASNAIASLAPASVDIQSCHACNAEVSACLTICPKCKAVLYVEPAANTKTSDGAEPPGRAQRRYCPVCGARYSATYERRTVCGLELVSEELRGRPLDERQKTERIVAVWRGGDPLAFSEAVNRLRDAGIRHHLHATEDHLVFELGMPRPKYMVRVFESDAPRAHELLASINESLPFGLSFTPVTEEEAVTPLPRSGVPWNAAAATVEVWSGEDAPAAELVEACLRENRIGVRRTGLEPGKLRLFVMSADEASAREIVREVQEGAPLA